MIRSHIIPTNLNDTICNLATSEGSPAGLPKGDPKSTPTAVKPIPPDDAPSVLRGGVADTAMQWPQEQTYLLAGDAGGMRHAGRNRIATPIVLNDGPTYKNLGDLSSDGDVMALAFIVMMEAAKSAREDLKSIMDGVKAINKEKEGTQNPWKTKKT